MSCFICGRGSCIPSFHSIANNAFVSGEESGHNKGVQDCIKALEMRGKYLIEDPSEVCIGLELINIKKHIKLLEALKGE